MQQGQDRTKTLGTRGPRQLTAHVPRKKTLGPVGSGTTLPRWYSIRPWSLVWLARPLWTPWSGNCMFSLSTILSTHVHYMRLPRALPRDIAKEYPRPVNSSTPVYSVQAPSAQPWVAPPPVVPPPSVAPPPPARLPHAPWSQRDTSTDTPASDYFRFVPRHEGCTFCTRPGHVIRTCHTASDYVNSGFATLQDGRICLPTGDPILNSGSGRGLKHAIDEWLAKHGQSPGGNESDSHDRSHCQHPRPAAPSIPQLRGCAGRGTHGGDC